MRLRTAATADLATMRELMRSAIDGLQQGFLSDEEIAASHAIMGLDTQLVADGTYLVVEIEGNLAGCGGWSRRATLYGGDHSEELRESRLLDPRSEAARVRAMYTHPSFARRGVGRLILASSEAAAAAEGFRRAELMSTLAGEALYAACGYRAVERASAIVGGITIPLVRMEKAFP